MLTLEVVGNNTELTTVYRIVASFFHTAPSVPELIIGDNAGRRNQITAELSLASWPIGHPASFGMIEIQATSLPISPAGDEIEVWLANFTDPISTKSDVDLFNLTEDGTIISRKIENDASLTDPIVFNVRSDNIGYLNALNAAGAPRLVLGIMYGADVGRQFNVSKSFGVKLILNIGSQPRVGSYLHRAQQQ